MNRIILMGSLLIVCMAYSDTYRRGPTNDSSFTYTQITTFQAVQKIRDVIHELLSEYDKNTIDFVVDPRKMSPIPNTSSNQTKQGLRILFDDRGIPTDLATPWGSIELCGVYFNSNFDHTDSAVIFSRLIRSINIRLLSDLSCDVVSIDGDILPTSVLAQTYEYMSSDEVLDQWLELNDWYARNVIYLPMHDE